MLINGGYLLYYNEDSQRRNPSINLNQNEQMEFGNNIRYSLFNNLNCDIGTKFKRSILNTKCLSFDTPYYEESDYFRVQGEYGHDLIELKISLNTAIAFEYFFQENNSIKIKKYLKNLINGVKQKKDTWSFGSISDDDKDLMKNFIYDGYLKFHDNSLELIEAENIKKKDNSIFIRTWRTYNWKDLNEQQQNNAFYISKSSKGDN